MSPADDTLLPYRLKTVRFAIQTTILTLVALVLFLILPGHGQVETLPFAVLIAVAAVLISVMAVLPWERLLGGGAGLRIMYAWSAGDIMLVTAAIGVTGGGRSYLFLLYLLTTAFSGCAYSGRAQAWLLAFTVSCYLGVVALTGWDMSAAVLSFRLATLVILAFLVTLVSQELTRQMTGHHEARKESERRAALLATVASAARGMTALDPDHVLEAVIHAAASLGFETAAVGVFDDSGNYRMVRAERVPEDLERLIPPSEGLVGVVWHSRRTVMTEDYASEPWAIAELKAAGIKAAVAAPIWAHGELVAALVYATARTRQITRQEVEAIELLAAQTGTALHVARRFEHERRAVERLAELDRLKGDFLSNVSHELRTPLTVIIGNGRTLAMCWDDLADDLKRELLGRLNDNAVSLEVIITALLDFSRLEAGHVSLRVETFDLGALVGSAAGRLSSLFSQHPLTSTIEPGLGVLADATLIDRVVENLLVNACRHTPAGTPVTLSARREGDMALVEVADQGPGIQPEDLGRLGERFFRGREATARRVRGTGLGLALVREVLSLHGATLEVSSAVGLGSRFSFRLPLARIEAPGPVPAAELEPDRADALTSPAA